MAKTKRKTAKKKSQVNKSSAIRECKAKNPSMKPKAISESLAKQGIEVSAAFVSTVLSNSKTKSKSTSAGRGKRAGSIAVDDLVLAKKLAAEMGGIDRARDALSALARLQ